MTKTTPARWLDPEEDRTWRSVWTLMTWLPVRLDAQLRADAGLGLAEYNALSQISEAPDRSMRLSDLAAGANMTLSHLSRVTSRLEKAGWVTRSPDPEDGRYTLGRLTDAGWEKVAAVAPGHVDAVRACVFDNLSDEQARALGEAAALVAEAVVPSGTVGP
ncbi:MarR family winged helix-turn-helix transcriptional regulator [Nocardiopsis sp. JB363]|uniref:MarR family winged helix-turn-helix transcriptional regulator n=1 Tax=Nocardiopsis sp. JB363 TaxID=1434837 RepID=UPI00097B2DDF|nr:MarR family transcriptional regulator [Nocardiopsis sp. JB363]SIO84603.1 Transcriptional regulator, MarR family [Nocardiopsis sp. JB363]